MTHLPLEDLEGLAFGELEPLWRLIATRMR